MTFSCQVERITRTSPKDYFKQMAEIHCQELGDGFLSTMGPRFLTRLYRGIAASPEAIMLAAIHDGHLAGFICGSTNTRRVYTRFLLTRGWLAAPRLLPELISTRRLRLVCETLLYPSRRQSLDLPEAEILNFCVRSSVQGQGIGKRLFGELIREFDRRGVHEIRIVTGQEQRKAQQFYESVKAKQKGEIQVHRGAVSLVYVFVVCSPAAVRAA